MRVIAKAFLVLSMTAILVVGLNWTEASAIQMARDVLDGGGAVWTATASYKLSSSVGQSVTGFQTTATKKLYTGFWNPWVVETSPVEEEEEDQALRPGKFDLRQNYPNPFNPNTIINYALPKTSHVKVEIFNILGQRVRTLVNEEEGPGYKSIKWDGKDQHGNQLGSGVYFCRIEAGDFTSSRKMTLLK